MSQRLPLLLTLIAAGLLAVCGGAFAAGVGSLVLPVPRITIYPGDIITSEALGSQTFGPLSERLPVYRTPDALIGKVARRTLLPGKPIPINALRDADVVQLGKQVRIVFEADGLTITGVGVALQNGGVGDVLSLRNTDSGTTVKGTVQADGSVKVLP